MSPWIAGPWPRSAACRAPVVWNGRAPVRLTLASIYAKLSILTGFQPTAYAASAHVIEFCHVIKLSRRNRAR